jgi:Flp pilus assembly pilin Flp
MVFQSWIDRIRFQRGQDEGQTMAEYAVILGVITPAIILALAALSGSVGTLLDKVRALFGA